MGEIVEKSGDGHLVSRELVISRRRPIVGSNISFESSDSVDWGEPMSEEGFAALKEFVSTYLESLDLDYNNFNFEEIINRLAKQVETDFQFIEQGTGISTMLKQLKTYKEEKLRYGSVSPSNFDCKFPTIILGMVCEKLKAKYKISSVKLLIRSNGSHPHLLISLNNNRSYLIDFVLVESVTNEKRSVKSKTNLKIFDTSASYDKEVLEKTLSFSEQLDLSQEGIALIDQNFIHS